MSSVQRAEQHVPVVRADMGWLHGVIQQLEGCPELLARLDVVFTDMAESRSGRLEIPDHNATSVRESSAVRTVRRETRSPVQFRVLTDKLGHAFPQAGDP
ncbi:hypothetical protein FHX42_001193 [Saccharopolyspora lacisalsi]|uniref:Lantibiotic dehydratase N-terminal domain-containing protein n=1 Tax=Halosaccharopolyspora lacisalsi TaxID=1000566 RepID=A0A839DQS4_9PSEU|nr:hypothetical protein [Halosaccharopolyspora lacisalsi]